jgi:hypothetical protein
MYIVTVRLTLSTHPAVMTRRKTDEDLTIPGHRSGTGAESVAKYLLDALKSNPNPAPEPVDIEIDTEEPAPKRPKSKLPR